MDESRSCDGARTCSPRSAASPCSGSGCSPSATASVSDVEEDVFRAVNDLPEFLYPVLWPVQQLGALVVGPIVAVVALIARKPRLAIAALVVTALKLLSERVVKSLVSRQRPGTSVGDINDRGDVSLAGESFVSGHAVLAAALACDHRSVPPRPVAARPVGRSSASWRSAASTSAPTTPSTSSAAPASASPSARSLNLILGVPAEGEREEAEQPMQPPAVTP